MGLIFRENGEVCMDDRHTQERPAASKSRRDFLKTAGKLAVYTPPVLMAMSRPSHALFMKSNGGTPVDGGHEYDGPQ
jgi:hypothetical protein